MGRPAIMARERGHPGYHDADRISAACYSRQAQALRRRVASRWIPAFAVRFRGYDKGGFPGIANASRDCLVEGWIASLRSQ